MDRVSSGTSIRHGLWPLAEVSLRVQYVTEEAECGSEPFTLTLNGTDEIGSKVSALPMSRQQKVSWTLHHGHKDPESASSVPNSSTFLRSEGGGGRTTEACVSIARRPQLPKIRTPGFAHNLRGLLGPWKMASQTLGSRSGGQASAWHCP